MGRKDDSRTVYRCTEAFAVPNLAGFMAAYAAGDEVLDDDPILKTHGALFEPASARIAARQPRVETTTAAPGETRGPVIPTKPAMPGTTEGETRG